MKPIIGITPDHIVGSTKVGDNYLQAVLAQGGIPVVLPLEINEKEMEQLINLCHGFIFTGGGDVDPVYFGEETLTYSGEIFPIRDKMEIPLMRLLAKIQKPVLGICRGVQVMNIALGGSVYQDIQAQFKQSIALNHNPKAPFDHPIHNVSLSTDSLLHTLTQKETLRVNSVHHQGIKDIGKGLQAVATAPCGLVEAVENPKHPFFMGVQWHPEKMPKDEDSQKLFEGFVKACIKSANE